MYRVVSVNFKCGRSLYLFHTIAITSITLHCIAKRMDVNELGHIALFTAADADSLVVPSGRHEYAFTVQLPYNLPSTFVSDCGHVRYLATVTLERPWLPKITKSREFTVASVLDLNGLPEAKVCSLLFLSLVYFNLEMNIIYKFQKLV